jgi:hypothetical protein
MEISNINVVVVVVVVPLFFLLFLLLLLLILSFAETTFPIWKTGIKIRLRLSNPR